MFFLRDDSRLSHVFARVVLRTFDGLAKWFVHQGEVNIVEGADQWRAESIDQAWCLPAQQTLLSSLSTCDKHNIQNEGEKECREHLNSTPNPHDE